MVAVKLPTAMRSQTSAGAVTRTCIGSTLPKMSNPKRNVDDPNRYRFLEKLGPRRVLLGSDDEPQRGGDGDRENGDSHVPDQRANRAKRHSCEKSEKLADVFEQARRTAS